MATSGGPQLITDGLILYLDAANIKSYSSLNQEWNSLVSNNTGVLVNGPVLNSDGLSIKFDGINDYYDISFSYDIYNGGVNNPITMEIWAKHDFLILQTGGIFSGAYGSNRFIGMVFGHNYSSSFGTRIRFNALYGGIGSSEHDTYIEQDEQWHHFTMTLDESLVSRLYIDGILKSTKTVTLTELAYFTDIRIARDRGGSNYLPVAISSLLVYNRCLSTSEVLERYNSLKPRFLYNTLDPNLIYSKVLVAYSLQNLTGNPSTNVVRVRRSSDNSESNFTSDDVFSGVLENWVGIGNDGFVTKWINQLGATSRDATQTVVSQQPRIVLNGVLEEYDGKAGLNIYSGGSPSQFLNITSLPSNIVLDSFSIMSNIKGFNNAPASIVEFLSYNNRTIRLRYSTLDPSRLYESNKSGVLTSNNKNNTVIANVLVNGDNSYLRHNNETGINEVFPSLNITDAIIGDNFYGNNVRGFYHELIIYNSDMSESRDYILNNLNNRYNAFIPDTKLLLNKYPGSSFAYALIQLNSYITNIIRVRRSSDNSESDFTELEIKNGTLVSWVGSGDGFITKFYDQSGNGRDISQSVISDQSIIVKEGILMEHQGNPGFSKVGGYSLPSQFTASTNRGFTIFGVSYTFENITHYDTRLLPQFEFYRRSGVYDYLNTGILFNAVNNVIAPSYELFTNVSDGTSITTYINSTITNVTQNWSRSNLSFQVWTGLRNKNTNSSINSRFMSLIGYADNTIINRNDIENELNELYNIY